ncbi:Uncharacterized protein APZ42_033073 [Daphnia magna]|uniref:Uncharacterized protein n=1 Tax=Daphnia magna TaxID=35525 RepID=A0A0N7ZYN5_9CRUS|nr:Uncharacterized protein APZ42_033073 [Daphnia magna]
MCNREMYGSNGLMLVDAYIIFSIWTQSIHVWPLVRNIGTPHKMTYDLRVCPVHKHSWSIQLGGHLRN